MIDNIKKLYYSIGEVSNILDVEKYVLRYWEKEFYSLSPAKNSAGNRVYKEKDINLLKLIKYLLYKKKYTIEGANELIKEYSREDINEFAKTGKLPNLESDNKAELKKMKQVARNIKSGLKDILAILDSEE